MYSTHTSSHLYRSREAAPVHMSVAIGNAPPSTLRFAPWAVLTCLCSRPPSSPSPPPCHQVSAAASHPLGRPLFRMHAHACVCECGVPPSVIVSPHGCMYGTYHVRTALCDVLSVHTVICRFGTCMHSVISRLMYVHHSSCFSPSLPPSLSPSLPEPHSKREAPHASSASSSAGAGPCQVDTARRHIASELLHTEKNFVDILQIVVQVRP